MPKKTQAKPKWSVVNDCLRPVGELLVEFSRQLGRSKSEAWLPIRLWGAYKDHNLELAIVCLEVAVSVPFADRVRKRTRSVLRNWEKLHWDAVRTIGCTLGDDAIRTAMEREFSSWRERYPNGPPWSEYPEDSIAARAATVENELQTTGIYLQQASLAIQAKFSTAAIARRDVERVSASNRPKENYKRDLIRESIANGRSSNKAIQVYVQEKLGTDEKVSPKMISEVKQDMQLPPAK